MILRANLYKGCCLQMCIGFTRCRNLDIMWQIHIWIYAHILHGFLEHVKTLKDLYIYIFTLNGICSLCRWNRNCFYSFWWELSQNFLCWGMVWFNADSDTELEKSPTAKGNATPTVNQFRACSLPLPNSLHTLAYPCQR